MVRWLRKYFPRVGRQMNGFADAGEQRQYISTLSFTAKCNNDHDDEEQDNEYDDEDKEWSDIRIFEGGTTVEQIKDASNKERVNDKV